MEHTEPDASATRDEKWLAALFDAHHERLLKFAARRVGAETAQDIVAEVFATAWRRRREVPDPATGWLFQVARNVVMHEQRGSARRSRLTAALRLARAPVGRLESTVEVDEVLDRLHRTDAEILRLTVWEQLTPTEIAEVLRISPGAARTRLLRARRTAARLYEAREQPRPAAPPHTAPQPSRSPL